jgi:hypothetical protein
MARTTREEYEESISDLVTTLGSELANALPKKIGWCVAIFELTGKKSERFGSMANSNHPVARLAMKKLVDAAIARRKKGK